MTTLGRVVLVVASTAAVAVYPVAAQAPADPVAFFEFDGTTTSSHGAELHPTGVTEPEFTEGLEGLALVVGPESPALTLTPELGPGDSQRVDVEENVMTVTPSTPE